MYITSNCGPGPISIMSIVTRRTFQTVFFKIHNLVALALPAPNISPLIFPQLHETPVSQAVIALTWTLPIVLVNLISAVIIILRVSRLMIDLKKIKFTNRA